MSFHDLACNPVGRQDAQVALTFRGSKATRSATACSNLSISSWINRWSSSSILSGCCSSESSKRCNVKESTEKRLRRRGAWYRHVTVPPLRFYLYAYSSFATTTKTPDSSQQNLGLTDDCVNNLKSTNCESRSFTSTGLSLSNSISAFANLNYGTGLHC